MLKVAQKVGKHREKPYALWPSFPPTRHFMSHKQNLRRYCVIDWKTFM